MNELRNIDVAQADMRHAYYAGATGVTLSALAWFAAALTVLLAGPTAAVFALIIGGMFIHPGAILLSRLLGRPGAHDPRNPLARLAIESTLWLLLAIAIAWFAGLQRAEWFFIAMLLTIAGRYFIFSTLYGLRHYWACAATQVIGGIALATLNAPALTITLTTAILEFLFAAVIFSTERKQQG